MSNNIRRRAVAITGTNYRPLSIETQIKEELEGIVKLVNNKNNIDYMRSNNEKLFDASKIDSFNYDEFYDKFNKQIFNQFLFNLIIINCLKYFSIFVIFHIFAMIKTINK